MENQYYLLSVDQDRKIFETTVTPNKKLDKSLVEETIKSHLMVYPTDTLEWTKVSNDTKFVGDDIIDFYEMHNTKVCKLILKGDRTFYKKI